jgi:hypothetical protein
MAASSSPCGTDFDSGVGGGPSTQSSFFSQTLSTSQPKLTTA